MLCRFFLVSVCLICGKIEASKPELSPPDRYIDLTSQGVENYWIAEIREGIIFDGRIKTSNGAYFLRELQKNPWDAFSDLPIQSVSKKIAVISVPGEDEYYHWLLQVVPQLYLLEKANIQYDHVFISALSKPFQYATLELFNIPLEKVVQQNSSHLIQSAVVFIPSFSRMQFPRWMQEFLHRRFLANKPTIELPKKIYVSRQKASRRRIINALEIENFLSSCGYVEVDLADISVEHQAHLFANATDIVSLHGSGLANLIFSKKETRVIELSSGSGPDQLFRKISEVRDLVYINIDTRSATEKEGVRHLTNFTDVFVEPSLLYPVLQTR